ncbi:MAG: cupin domain-containing protein [Planctomycetota bacterium]|nr:cupin domain-containing protein [Planctomycetota bacterium]
MEVKNTSASERFSGEKMSKVNLFETPRFFCDVYCLQPGQSQRLHTHAASDKVYHVLRGEPTVTVGDESRILGPGDTVLAAAGAVHGVANAGTEESALLVFMAPHPDAAG